MKSDDLIKKGGMTRKVCDIILSLQAVDEDSLTDSSSKSK